MVKWQLLMYADFQFLQLEPPPYHINAYMLYLLPLVFDLEVFGRLLGDPASKVQLVDLAGLVPHGRLVVEDKPPPLDRGAVVTTLVSKARQVAKGVNL